MEQGDDIPLAQAYCASVHESGRPLEVMDGRTDPRYPHMAGMPVISYCGALIRDASGAPFGALCHYDLLPCQSKTSEMSLLAAAAPLIHAFLAE